MNKILLLLLLLNISNSFAVIRYVSTIPTGLVDGSSWSNASNNLQAMIDASAASDEVWVKSGTYVTSGFPTGCTTCTLPQHNAFALKNGVAIFGGFAGTESLLSERNITLNETILSGNNISYHVIVSIGNASNLTIIDGFTITGGVATVAGNIFVNAVLVQNSGGGGLINITSNTQILNCTFKNNSARQGGGIRNAINSNSIITNCTFSNNFAQISGGGISNASSPVITNTLFNNNISASTGGGGIESNTPLTLLNCAFISNSTTASLIGGGGIYSTQSATLLNCFFMNNSVAAGVGGGGVYVAQASTLTNCVFASNSTSGASTHGAGLYSPNASNLTNCTFYNNRTNGASALGGGLYSSSGAGTVKNCIFWNNTTAIATDAGREEIHKNAAGNITVSNSIIRDALPSTNVLDGGANSNLDPLFFDTLNILGADGIAATADDGLNLQSTSFAIDNANATGVPTNDITGAVRFDLSGVGISTTDIGAYEFIQTILVDDKRGKMYDFDGINQNIIVNDKSSLRLSSNNFTIEFWAKPTLVDNNFHWVISKDNTNADLDYLIGISSNNEWRFIMRNLAIDIFSGVPAIAGKYYHIACTFDGIEAKLYVDGVVMNSSPVAGVGVSNTANLVIGARTANSPIQFFEGSIDEVRFWNVERTQNEIRENRHLTLLGTEPGLIAYYQFNLDGVVGGTRQVLDAMGLSPGTCTNMLPANLVDSEVAVGGGTSDRGTVTGINASFTGINTESQIDFGNTCPEGEIVVTRIFVESAHDWASTGDLTTFDSYYVINNYGVNSTFDPITNIVFTMNGVATSTNVTEFFLYKRESNEYGPTWGSSPGNPALVTLPATFEFGASANITSFSSFIVTQNNSLPTELFNFNAQRKSYDNVNLNWNITQEINLMYYQVERSFENNQDFKEIGKVMANKNNSYSFFDLNNSLSNTYYRLKLVDLDGSFKYSNEVMVIGNSTQTSVAIYPNPSTGFFNLSLSNFSQPVEITIVDLLGKLIINQIVANENVLSLNLENQTKGMYILKIKSSEVDFTQKLILE